MANLDNAAPKIAQARSAGYSDDEIVNFLSEQAPEKFKQAKDAGYSASEILSHLTTAPKAQPAPDDHGLARRQKMTQAELAVSPFTELPGNIRGASTEATQQVWRGVEQLKSSFSKAKGDLSQPGELGNLWEATKGIGNVGLGALGAVAAPVTGVYRSFLGQPVEDITGIPREYTEFGAQLATPGIGFTKLAGVPGEIPRGPMIRPAEAPPGRPVVQEAAQRLNEAGLPVDVPRAVTGGRVAQSTGQYVSNVPFVGAPVSEAVHTTLPQQLEAARNAIAAEHGAGTGPNVASRVGGVLNEGAAAETRAAEQAAARANEQAAAEWQRANAQRDAEIAAGRLQSTQAAQRAVGPDATPADMGGAVIDQVRAAHDAAENAKNVAYREAGSQEGTVFDRTVGSADRRISADLRSDREGQGTVTITPTLTPAANEMQNSMRVFSERARQRQAQAQAEAIAGGGTAQDAAQTGINLRTLETQRQELGNMAQGAANDADRRAARRIMNAFDDWHEAAIERHFDGDPAALEAYRRARALNRDWRTRFGYNARDDADKLINKIVRGEEDQHTGPVGVSNALTAGGDKSGPLFTRVMEATNNHPDILQAIRSGTWNKLTQPVEAGSVRAPKEIADSIAKHLYGSGRDVAERVFTPEQRALMRAHADTVRAIPAQERAAAEAAKAATPVPIKAEPGPLQQLTERVLGRGQKSDEALFNTIHGLAQKGGDVKTLARLMQQLPQEMRGDLAGSLIRNLGVNRAGNFTLDQFASQWKNITPQAKSIMFGNAGPHVTALNDIAIIADRLKEVKGRFGNPSGTAQNSLFAALAAIMGSSVLGAAKTVALGGAGHVVARVLASPAGASSIVKYARAVERANQAASPANIAAVNLMQRNLANTARALTAIH
jgi:hypothetical protein